MSFGLNNRVLVIFLLFLVLHVALFNINAAEWGDSYRILRASEHIRGFSYPEDEKRPPLLSAVLAIRPENVDAVNWAKVIMMMFSIGSFMIFYKLFRLVSKEGSDSSLLGLLLFALNPVYLYWSVRIMADVPFSFLAVLSVYLLTLWKDKVSVGRLALLSIVTAFSALMRFEGYILFFAILGGLVFKKGINSKSDIHPSTLFNKIKLNFKNLITYTLFFVLTMLPFWIYRNPLTTSYFEEPTGRTYDAQMVLVYLVSILFLFGFTSAFFFLANSHKRVVKYFTNNPAILFFVAMELMLIIFWPAAVPRLFVAVIPFLVIPLADGMSKEFNNRQGFKAAVTATTSRRLVFLLGLLGAYVVVQYTIRLQFLAVLKEVIMTIAILQLVMIGTILLKKYNLFVLTLLFSMLIWSAAVIWSHKDIFRGVQQAAVYAVGNAQGLIIYNDVSSVTPWYVGNRGFRVQIPGEVLESEYLLENNVEYVLITNEHNRDLEIDLDKRQYLTLEKEFKYNINGTEFFTKVAKFKP